MCGRVTHCEYFGNNHFELINLVVAEYDFCSSVGVGSRCISGRIASASVRQERLLQTQDAVKDDKEDVLELMTNTLPASALNLIILYSG